MPALLISSPIGDLTLIGTEVALTEIRFGACAGTEPLGETPILQQAAAELKAYFAGNLRTFSVPLAPKGTPFQQQVWMALREIPYGQTVSYSAIADRIHNPKAVRAVGMANNRNPLPIIVPCHRVIGKSGQMVGYRSGLPIKEWLLSLEQGKQGKEG